MEFNGFHGLIIQDVKKESFDVYRKLMGSRDQINLKKLFMRQSHLKKLKHSKPFFEVLAKDDELFSSLFLFLSSTFSSSSSLSSFRFLLPKKKPGKHKKMI